MSEPFAQGLVALIQYLGPYPFLLATVILFLAPLGAVIWVVWRVPKLANKITAAHGKETREIIANNAAETRVILQKQDERMLHIFDRQDKKHSEVVEMYKSNVELVRAYETVTHNYHEITDNLQELVMITTQTMQQLVGKIENNRYCPVVKQTLNGTVVIGEEKKHGQPGA